MRKKFEVQYELGATPIEKIQIPKNLRDEIPPILRGLQYIYSTPVLNEKVFKILEKKIVPGINTRTGRPGMTLWEILVFGTVRLARNANYDQLQFDADYNSLIRKLVGISDFSDNKKNYPLQTLKDNISLFDEKILDEINEIVVRTGHNIKKNEELDVKVDTYVLETNVHFPTDINLLWDAGRKSIELVAHIIQDSKEDFGWRKHHAWRKKLKAAYHNAAKCTVGVGRHTTKGFDAAMNYLTIADSLSQKIKSTKSIITELASMSIRNIARCCELDYYENHLDKHIELVRRRLILSETIPHDEKIFSLFEPHTEWIKKGKAGDKVELGLRIAVATDQYGFVLGHQVMLKKQDVDIAVPFVKMLANKYKINVTML
jgi:transposase, IS5 family